MNFAKTIAAIALATASLAAQATPLTFQSLYDPSPNLTLSSAWNKNGYASFAFDLGPAYDKTKYDIESASIVFSFGNISSDDSFTLKLGSATQFVPSSNLSSNYTVQLVNTLPDLIADGKIGGSIDMYTGSLVFKSATLTATYSVKQQDPTPPANPVPEPASLALMGLGLGALAMRRRKG